MVYIGIMNTTVGKNEVDVHYNSTSSAAQQQF
jgi:hypothetical protein